MTSAWRWPGLIVKYLVPAGAPVTVAVDGTLFRRRGKKVFISSLN